MVLKTRAWRWDFHKLLEEFKILLLNLLVHQERKQGPDLISVIPLQIWIITLISTNSRGGDLAPLKLVVKLPVIQWS